ncbi:osmotically inducible protein OsmC [Tranquillimonas rosea]|uniref:Osmotically inducible protein OsmC n=1 Tax=Tranquillimonas rosea TaxID=641238 RepID=A0A1H9X7X6_9RHOB|nr:OsmC family protein [Tranquillimonas rosea]SES42235.1 osmotically inducible protein OsmC [Tranquillimonas rosea]
MKRTGSAVWNGDLPSGKGSISTPSGTLKDTQFSFKTRFEDGTGTNPEELIAGAHAGCFSMAFSNELASAGFTPDSVATEASVQLDQVEGGFAITSIHLECEAKVPNIDESKFQEIAEGAKKGCPVSKALASVEITLTAKLMS